MKVTADQIADELRGTCKSLRESLEGNESEHLENDAKFCSQLDSLVFCCDRCGWWDEIAMMSESEDWVCEDCSE